jgi:exopolysaccharide biosynthesis WecB/TagA/CpsF family protein
MDFIKNSGAGICFVALGAPKQEIFSDRCAQEMAGISFICIGAGLDFLAGHQRRAPEFFQKTGLEWLWRVLNNPRRLARRYLECLFVFPGVLLDGLARR